MFATAALDIPEESLVTEQYPAYSSSAAGGPAGGPVARPSTVNTAFFLYLAVAVLGLLGVLVALASVGAARAQVERQLAAQGQSLPAGTLDGILAASIGIGIGVGVISAALYVLFAFFMRRGANWARIVLTVLSAFGIVGGLLGLGNIAQTFGLGLIQLLLLIAAVVLMYLRPSMAYFRGVGASRLLR